MNVLVLGATGYIGAAVTERLVAAGHRVTAASRSAGPATVPAGATPVAVDLTDPAAVAALVTDDVDTVVHAAAPLGDADLPLVEALAGTGRPLLWTSGIWVLGRTGGADEDAPVAPIAIVGPRRRVEENVLAAGGVVLRPGVVHGRGGGSIPGLLVAWAQQLGHGRWVGGDESPRWPMVHVDDLADLYLLALTAARPGTVLHGVTEPGVRAGELARAAARGQGAEATAVAWPEADAATELGAPFAEALGLDQVVTADRARALGWSPGRPGAADDLATGSYVPAG
ncbi:NAD-dependent epimerase/dehydratase family protein [Cryptosporangium japonicum]|uniref:NAD-dependent epimerase/dehydratase family protein n=1 Tax=Cryptosporangium japonicum TaxID=80872 RepID=A0ABP3DN21_9ACTN